MRGETVLEAPLLNLYKHIPRSKWTREGGFSWMFAAAVKSPITLPVYLRYTSRGCSAVMPTDEDELPRRKAVRGPMAALIEYC